MLLYNVSQQLRNGTCGEFVGVDPNGEALLVNFPKVGLVAIQRRIWYKYDATGKVKSSRTQFPLSLCYAITTHKSQGLTMERIVVHCSPEFIPGQTYVAISRVRHADDVRVVGFRKYFLMPPPTSLTKLTTTSSGEPVPTLRCCRKIELDKACSFAVTEEIKSCIDDENGVTYDGLEYETAAKDFFESAEGVSVNLEDVLLCLSDFTHELSHPPIDFDIKTFVELHNKCKDPFSKAINSAASFAMDNLQTFNLLACVLWCRIATLFNDYLTENLNDIHITSKNFTCATGKLHELFMTNEYRSDIISAFNVEKWSDVNVGQRSLAAQLLFHLYGMFTAEVGKRVRKQEEQDPVCFRVDEMESEGKGKIRYIGGWAVRKSLEKSRRYVEANKQSETKAVGEKVVKEMKKMHLLENNVIMPFATLSNFTLNVTECHQFRERGLLHISDGAYEFFLSLEQERVNNINLVKLTSHQSNMVDMSIKAVSSNKTLINHFGGLFHLDEDEDKVCIRFY
jgi:hypothetical protein